MNRTWLPLIAAATLALATSTASIASAATLTLATGSSGRELSVLRDELAEFTRRTGIDVTIVSTVASPLSEFDQIQRWLTGRNSSIDVYRTDITWVAPLARHLVDLAAAVKDIADGEIPGLIRSETVGEALRALPYTADVPALYYRTDLLAKYHLAVPSTWVAMEAAAATVMNGERAAGDGKMWGYAFPGAVSEDLTANGLEWVAGNGGGGIVESDGTISIDNVKAILAVEVAEKWVGTIAPPETVTYRQADARRLWLSGEAAFTRDWHDVVGAAEAAQSPIRGKVGVAMLPLGEHGDTPAATLGGWSLAVSRYSTHRDDAVALVRFLASAEAQKTYEVGMLNHLPATVALYDDPAIARWEPDIATFKAMLPNLVVRPSAVTGDAYPRVSASFALAMNRSLKHDAFAEDFLQSYRHQLEAMARIGWKPTVARGQSGDAAP